MVCTDLAPAEVPPAVARGTEWLPGPAAAAVAAVAVRLSWGAPWVVWQSVLGVVLK